MALPRAPAPSCLPARSPHRQIAQLAAVVYLHTDWLLQTAEVGRSGGESIEEGRDPASRKCRPTCAGVCGVLHVRNGGGIL
jgi:hypothetical protein